MTEPTHPEQKDAKTSVTTNQPVSIGNPALDALHTLIPNAAPVWIANFKYIVILVVVLVAALGLNLGKMFETYIDNQVSLQTVEVAQQNKVESDALTALIDINVQMGNHVTQLISSVNSLIEENKRLTIANEDTKESYLALQEQMQKIEELNAEYILKIEELSAQIAALQKQNSELQKQLETR